MEGSQKEWYTLLTAAANRLGIPAEQRRYAHQLYGLINEICGMIERAIALQERGIVEGSAVTHRGRRAIVHKIMSNRYVTLRFCDGGNSSGAFPPLSLENITPLH